MNKWEKYYRISINADICGFAEKSDYAVGCMCTSADGLQKQVKERIANYKFPCEMGVRDISISEISADRVAGYPKIKTLYRRLGKVSRRLERLREKEELVNTGNPCPPLTMFLCRFLEFICSGNDCFT